MRFSSIAFFTFLTASLYAQSDLFMLDLEDLSSIELKDTSATLTKTDIKNVPASITLITHQDILESGARNLDELLEIFVPSFTYMNKVQGTQIGFRGIISDRNNKVLLLVNNRVMNVKATDGGAITERWFSTLSDIESIKVITGSGSAIYGSGAISGVISIETFSGKTRDGINISSKAGIGEEFYNAELSYGTKLQDDIYLYLYYGIDKYNGADNDKAPMRFAFDYSGGNNIDAPAEENFPYRMDNDNSSLENKFRHKIHLQIDGDDFCIWSRFTKTSLATPTAQFMYLWISDNKEDNFKNTGSQNQQLTVFGEKTQRVLNDIDITYQISYQRSDVSNNFYNTSQVNIADKFWGEDNLMLKILAHYDIDSKNQLALGAEYNYNWFGRSSDISSYNYSKTSVLPENTKWESYLTSIFGEYQTNFTQNLTMFVGTRVDEHKYVSSMYSPRVNFVYNNNDTDVVKLGFNRSLRHNDEAVLYANNKYNNTNGDVEQIDTLELIYMKYMKNITLSISTFYNDHDLVSWDNTRKSAQNIGNMKSYGGEIELNYKTSKILFNISHSFSKLREFTLNNSDIKLQNVSANAYGYGDDFANWNNHITKLRFNYKIKHNLKWVNSLRIFWGMDGAKDMANYNIDTNGATNKKYILPYYDDDNTRAFEESIYLNSALVWNYDKQTTLQLNAYNILGIFDEDLNKRNFFQTTSQYRDAAPSLSVGLNY
jgi:outer membrane receptor for ferrienterochelin and colicin